MRVTEDLGQLPLRTDQGRNIDRPFACEPDKTRTMERLFRRDETTIFSVIRTLGEIVFAGGNPLRIAILLFSLYNPV
jgi:hypothetical protein